MELQRGNLRRWKIEVQMDSLSKPNKRDVYESIRKHFHLKREEYGTHRMDINWISVDDVTNDIERFMSQSRGTTNKVTKKQKDPNIVLKWIDQTIEDIDVIKEFGLYYQIDFETAELNRFLLKMKFLIDKDIKNGILK